MKIVPAYKLMGADDALAAFLRSERGAGRIGRKAVVLVLEGDEEFPAGTPAVVGAVRVYRTAINHFHAGVSGALFDTGLPDGPENVAVAPSKRLGSGRQALRRLIAQYPPVSRAAQRAALRRLVREGD